MLLCRVTMGHPYMTDHKHQNERLPPENPAMPGALSLPPFPPVPLPLSRSCALAHSRSLAQSYCPSLSGSLRTPT